MSNTIFNGITNTVTEANALVNFQDFHENYLNSKMMLDIFNQNHTNSQ